MLATTSAFEAIDSAILATITGGCQPKRQAPPPEPPPEPPQAQPQPIDRSTSVAVNVQVIGYGGAPRTA